MAGSGLNDPERFRGWRHRKVGKISFFSRIEWVRGWKVKFEWRPRVHSVYVLAKREDMRGKGFFFVHGNAKQNLVWSVGGNYYSLIEWYSGNSVEIRERRDQRLVSWEGDWALNSVFLARIFSANMSPYGMTCNAKIAIPRKIRVSLKCCLLVSQLLSVEFYLVR